MINIDKVKEEIKSWLVNSKWFLNECYDNIVIQTDLLTISIDADNILSNNKIKYCGKYTLKLINDTYLKYLPESDSFIITSK